MPTGSAVFTDGHPRGFPTFCAAEFSSDDTITPWIDFWAVTPCGDPEADYAQGQRYADEAIGHVRTTGQPTFIDCVLIFMSMKLRHREPGEMELGFINGISGDFPDAVDDVMARLSRFRLRHLT
jgi:hypothetical protein